MSARTFSKRRSKPVGKWGRVRLRPIVWPRALVAIAVGAVYGLLALEAISPVGILLVGWMVAILVLAWRLRLKARVVAASAGGLVVGFGLLWAAVLETQRANCKPPTCATADPSTDLLYALAFLAAVIAVGGAEIGVRAWLLRHRPSSSKALDRRVR
jgi:hypothetical protein